MTGAVSPTAVVQRAAIAARDASQETDTGYQSPSLLVTGVANTRITIDVAEQETLEGGRSSSKMV